MTNDIGSAALPSVARRERVKATQRAELPANVSRLFPMPRHEPPRVSKAAERVVVEIKPRPRIEFLEVVRNDVGEVVGLQPTYTRE